MLGFYIHVDIITRYYFTRNVYTPLSIVDIHILAIVFRKPFRSCILNQQGMTGCRLKNFCDDKLIQHQTIRTGADHK